MKILVCGGRDFEDRDFVFRVLDDLHKQLGFYTLIHGACPTGADKFADDWAKERGVAAWAFPANWRKHGRAAGPIRNRDMAERTSPDFVVAFPGGAGTRNMIDISAELGINLIEPFAADTPSEDRMISDIQAAIREKGSAFPFREK
jgi:hypothetical protein